MSKGNTEKAKSLEEKFARQDAKSGSKMSVLNSTLSELTAIENSSQVYNLYENSSSVPSDADGITTYDISSGEVNISSKSAFSMGVFAHELKHAFQFQNGSLSFGSTGLNGGALYDISDEYEAFSRGSFFGGTNLTKNEINTIYKERGVPFKISSFSTPTESYPGAPTLKRQLMSQTTQNTIRGSAQTDFYIGSHRLVKIIDTINLSSINIFNKINVFFREKICTKR